MHVTMYTDGAARGNPGPGGYGCVLQFTDGNGRLHERELSQGFECTTNQPHGAWGVIAGFEVLKHPCRVTVTPIPSTW